MEQTPLYEQINWALLAYDNNPIRWTRINGFLCPSAETSPSPTDLNNYQSGGPSCNYAVSAGTNLYFAGNLVDQNGPFTYGREIKMGDISDGTSNTILMSEMLSGDGTANKYTPGEPIRDKFFTGTAAVGGPRPECLPGGD